ncbi:hypothetical protein [Raoultella terrigena]|uniref:hypothetical protein n=1 Tax=Raoultella terrigena TaxID=577 RepID=UPI0030E0D6C2
MSPVASGDRGWHLLPLEVSEQRVDGEGEHDVRENMRHKDQRQRHSGPRREGDQPVAQQKNRQAADLQPVAAAVFCKTRRVEQQRPNQLAQAAGKKQRQSGCLFRRA